MRISVRSIVVHHHMVYPLIELHPSKLDNIHDVVGRAYFTSLTIIQFDMFVDFSYFLFLLLFFFFGFLLRFQNFNCFNLSARQTQFPVSVLLIFLNEIFNSHSILLFVRYKIYLQYGFIDVPYCGKVWNHHKFYSRNTSITHIRIMA